MEPLLGRPDKQASRVAEVGIIGIKNVGGEKGSEIDNELVGGWHESFAESTNHLVRVQLLVELPLFICMLEATSNQMDNAICAHLEGGVIAVLWQQWLMVIIAPTKAKK